MPTKLQIYLHDCLSKIKNPVPAAAVQLSASTKRIVSGCRHPRTLSFALDKHQAGQGDQSGNEAATLADIDRFLLENFKSLYVKDDFEVKNDEKKGETEMAGAGAGHHHDHQEPALQSPREVLFGSPRLVDPPPNLCGSSRFFVAPSLTASLIEEARMSVNTSTSEDEGSSSTSTASTATVLREIDDAKEGSPSKECIAVLTYTRSPYDDFRRSMLDIVDARLQHRGEVDWDFMEELLFCFLNLNDKNSSKFILRAFVDVIVDMRRQCESKAPARSRRRRRRARHNVTCNVNSK